MLPLAVLLPALLCATFTAAPASASVIWPVFDNPGVQGAAPALPARHRLYSV